MTLPGAGQSVSTLSWSQITALVRRCLARGSHSRFSFGLGNGNLADLRSHSPGVHHDLSLGRKEQKTAKEFKPRNRQYSLPFSWSYSVTPPGAGNLLPLFLSIVISSLENSNARADELIQTFTIEERFGVSHPDQIIDFDFSGQADWANSYMIGPAGNEVTYQVLQGGKIVVRTDLAGNASKSWKLMSGRPPGVIGEGVQIVESEGYFEITNDRTGVRVTKVSADLRFPPAPVQGIRYRDGTWTPTGPNYLSFPGPNLCYGEKPTTAKSMAVRFLERGPLKTVVEVSYQTDRAKACYESISPRGDGYYKCVIEMQAGQPSILFEEDTDTDVKWSLDVFRGLAPTHGRYRGHHSTAKEYGYEPDGRQYRAGHERAGMDATVDLQFDKPTRFSWGERWMMSVWDPWAFNTGWYWQIFDTNAAVNGNLFGIFAGKPSRALGASASGVGIANGPLGVTDLVTQTDATGNLHAVWQSASDLWYLKFDSTLAPGTPDKVASGLQNPDLLVSEDGRVSIMAYDSVRSQFCKIEKSKDGPFTTAQLMVDQPDKLRVLDSFLYQASSGTNHFLFCLGEFNGKKGGLLFSRTFDQPQFASRDQGGSGLTCK